MIVLPFGQDASRIRLVNAFRELEACNQAISRHGLSLSAEDIQTLVVGRTEALQTAERIEFGGGVVKELVLVFADSPFVTNETFVQLILELQDLFYEVKNESLDQIADDELIARMRSLFDEFASGDLGYLAEALLEGLGRTVREQDFGDDADTDTDNAVMNALTLAHHRYDVSSWVDDTYAPPWRGASWLDE